MKRKLLSAFLISTLALAATGGCIRKVRVVSSPTSDEQLVVAYKDGWMAYSIDDWAVGEYHRRCDNGEDGATAWSQCLSNAAITERQWNSLSVSQKLAIPISPFWKRNVGEPRRIR